MLKLMRKYLLKIIFHINKKWMLFKSFKKLSCWFIFEFYVNFFQFKSSKGVWICVTFWGWDCFCLPGQSCYASHFLSWVQWWYTASILQYNRVSLFWKQFSSGFYRAQLLLSFRFFIAHNNYEFFVNMLASNEESVKF